MASEVETSSAAEERDRDAREHWQTPLLYTSANFGRQRKHGENFSTMDNGVFTQMKLNGK